MHGARDTLEVDHASVVSMHLLCFFDLLDACEENDHKKRGRGSVRELSIVRPRTTVFAGVFDLCDFEFHEQDTDGLLDVDRGSRFT